MKTIGQMLNVEPAGEPTHTDGAPLLQFTSHVAGKNARVAIYPDRIEWERLSWVTLAGRKDTNLIPVRHIQGITTQKAGLAFTTVRVATAGDATEFRVTKREAEQVRSTLLRLMNQPVQPVQQAATPCGPSQLVADEIRKLADLREAGLLTDAEFAAQKNRLLGA
jgi:hypothetical protein